jgi:DNA repair protein RadA/Sms
MAIASSCFETPLPEDLVVAGEVGLAGEIRRVGRLEERLREAHRMGFNQVCGPQAELEEIADKLKIKKIGVRHVRELFSPELKFFRKTK